DDDYREFAAQRIVKTLATFGIPSHVSDVITGPAVTRVEVVLGEGIRVNKVEGMEKDIAYILPAKRVRVEAPIPGKTAIGIEFPNIRTNLVRMHEVLETPQWKKARAPLTMALAKDLNNNPVLANLGRMPHLLVAGQTGSGKSVCLHSIIVSLLFRLTPDQLRLILIDPKMVEFGFYEGLPHLLTPVVNDVNDAVNALRWSVHEMRDRYRKLKGQRARDILAFNKSVKPQERMPFIVIIIDEMADLMAQEGYEIEACITSLTQLARAVGIHLILATQRPSVKIITGNIKGNIPARIALNVASYNDSRTILDYKGAESLLGNGDMLYKPVDEDTPIRAQGVFVEDDEIKKVVEFLSNQGEPDYDHDVTADHAPAKPTKVSGDSDMTSADDPVVLNALKVFMSEGEASTSMLQSKLKLGYPRARRLMMEMEEMGFVGPKNGSKPREIIYSACRQALESSAKSSRDIDPEFIPENDVDEIMLSM
ncbi:MAG TPA: DNA translocase FtsK, partial [Firmicutes bacterium]|nr:DNA translocase FtsK [Bacillota bacterium]